METLNLNNMTTSELNSKLTIKRVKNLKFGNSKGYYNVSGNVIYVEGLGYVSFKSDIKKDLDVNIPYQPIGKLSALKSIVKNGFSSYGDIIFINPID